MWLSVASVLLFYLITFKKFILLVIIPLLQNNKKLIVFADGFVFFYAAKVRYL